MAGLLQTALEGLFAGSVYGLLALGLVLIYRASRVISFAHGTLAMLSTFAAFSLAEVGVPLPVAFLGAALAGFVLGVGSHHLVSRAGRSHHHAQMMVTIALFMIGDGAANLIFGADPKAFGHYFATPGPIEVSGALRLGRLDLYAVATTLVLVLALGAFFRFTRAGLGLRAVADNPDAAELVGVRVTRMLALTWGVAAVLGAAAGLLMSPIVLLSPSMMFAPLLKAFAAAVLGGLDSARGAILGGWLLGLSEALAGAYVSTNLQGSLAFILLIAVLVFRPEGLTGRPQRAKL